MTGEMVGGYVLCFFVVAVISGFIGVCIGYHKGRDVEGFLLGFFFGIIGWIVVVLLSPRARVPDGMRKVMCPRCDASQNGAIQQPTYECWQCKYVARQGSARRHQQPQYPTVVDTGTLPQSGRP